MDFDALAAVLGKEVPALVCLVVFVVVMMRLVVRELRYARETLDGVLGRVLEKVDRIDVRTERCLDAVHGERRTVRRDVHVR